mmetsp:Transcript_18550/g.30551  ORF Transcript_18550/g.30551 Transcript_18550/m.30551 type:complete len:194 (+) Transcript_18550:6000-6581(+)
MSWANLKDAVLENDRVKLSRIKLSDREGFAKVAFFPEIWEHFVAAVHTDEDLDAYMESAIRDTLNGARAVFAIRDAQSGEIVGSSAYGNISEADRKLEIGWSWITTAKQRTGANRGAKLALLTHAFEVLGCERVEFKTDVLNTNARTALKGIGATEEGVLRSFNFMPGGRRRNAIFYSILKAEWPDAKQRLTA